MESTPRITVSYAQSLDGRIATSTGDSRWISCSRTLRLAHRLRADNEVIVAGIGTVLRDDPELSCRLGRRPRSPVRVILDSHLRLPLRSTIARTCRSYPTIVYSVDQAPEGTAAGVPGGAAAPAGETAAAGGTTAARSPALAARRAELERAGIEVCALGADESGRVCLQSVVENLAGRGFETVFVEGGAQVITSFLRAGLVHRMVVVTAPIIIGGGVEAVGDLGVTSLAQALRPRRSRSWRMGTDRVWELILR
jgi:riboflavin biosynthesis pyrimidine reductase